MNVMIYEPVFWGGHNLTYVRHLVRAIAGWPASVRLVTGEAAAESESYQLNLRSDLGGIADLQTSVPLPPTGGDWGRHYAEHLLKAVDEFGADHVFIPTGDAVTCFAGSRRLRGSSLWRRSLPEVDCNILNSFYASSVPWIQKPQRLRASVYASCAPWARLYTIDPFVSAARRPWAWMHRSVQILPDPIDIPPGISKDGARRVLGLPLDAHVIGAVGHFASNDRKNPVGLIQGFLQSGLARQCILALIGPMSRDVLDYVGTLGHQRERVVIIDRLLGSAEVPLAVAALDLVCLPYRDFYQPSAIALNAAVLGVPVLASKIGWFQDMIPLFRLGWVDDLSTPDRIAAALRKRRQQWTTFVPSEESRKLAAFSHPDNFAAIFCGPLRRRLGMPLCTDAVTWRSILPSKAELERPSVRG